MTLCILPKNEQNTIRILSLILSTFVYTSENCWVKNALSCTFAAIDLGRIFFRFSLCTQQLVCMYQLLLLFCLRVYLEIVYGYGRQAKQMRSYQKKIRCVRVWQYQLQSCLLRARSQKQIVSLSPRKLSIDKFKKNKTNTKVSSNPNSCYYKSLTNFVTLDLKLHYWYCHSVEYLLIYCSSCKIENDNTLKLLRYT